MKFEQIISSIENIQEELLKRTAVQINTNIGIPKPIRQSLTDELKNVLRREPKGENRVAREEVDKLY